MVWAFMPEFRIVADAQRGAKKIDSRDKGSIRVLLTLTSIASIIAYPIAFLSAGQFTPALRIPLFALGLSLLMLGSVLRRYSWSTLGRFFTGDVRVASDQPVIRSGPYRLVRHPAYSGGMLMYTGIGLCLGSLISLAVLTVSTAVAYAYRVTVEERALREIIGEPYVAYMSETKRFVPYII